MQTTIQIVYDLVHDVVERLNDLFKGIFVSREVIEHLKLSLSGMNQACVNLCWSQFIRQTQHFLKLLCFS